MLSRNHCCGITVSFHQKCYNFHFFFDALKGIYITFQVSFSTGLSRLKFLIKQYLDKQDIKNEIKIYIVYIHNRNAINLLFLLNYHV